MDWAIPSYEELCKRTDRPPGSSWGVFGDRDTIGTMNFLNEDSVRRAAHSVKSGRVFPLDVPLDEFPSGTGGRKPPKQVLYKISVHPLNSEPVPMGVEDYLDGFYLQGSSQWDALRHVRHPEHGYYNGFSEEDSAANLGIDQVAAKGIAGRGILLDIQSHCERGGKVISHPDRDVITLATIEDCIKEQGVVIEEGDILLVRTGWLKWYRSLERSEQIELMARKSVPSAGIGPAEEIAGFLWDHRIAAVAADNVALEATGRGSRLHFIAIPLLGLSVGEFWDLEQLANDCSNTRTYACLVVSAPLHLRGGAGSTANAVAIR
jgi:kynurenine formamidase